MIKQSKTQPNEGAARSSKTRQFVAMTMSIVTLAAVVAVAVWIMRSQPAASRQPAAPVASNTPAAAANAGAPFQAIIGKWLRPDGGYVLQIASADENGKLEAAYFNPNPIHVGRAHALRDGSALKVFVELNDVNYPGSTYTLAHDPASDQLSGIYYQAALGQRFEVVFERLK